jgi:hypothetical protein
MVSVISNDGLPLGSRSSTGLAAITYSNTSCSICMEESDLLYTCCIHQCPSLYCMGCIDQWWAVDNCPKTCALCKSTSNLRLIQNTTSRLAESAIFLARAEVTSVSINVSTLPSHTITFQPNIRLQVHVLVFHAWLHLLIHIIFISRFTTHKVDHQLKTYTIQLVIYCILMCLHGLWGIAMYVQRFQRSGYGITTLSMAAPTALFVFKLGVAVEVLPQFEFPLVILLSVIAFACDVVIFWTHVWRQRL